MKGTIWIRYDDTTCNNMSDWTWYTSDSSTDQNVCPQNCPLLRQDGCIADRCILNNEELLDAKQKR